MKLRHLTDALYGLRETMSVQQFNE